MIRTFNRSPRRRLNRRHVASVGSAFDLNLTKTDVATDLDFGWAAADILDQSQGIDHSVS